LKNTFIDLKHLSSQAKTPVGHQVTQELIFPPSTDCTINAHDTALAKGHRLLLIFVRDRTMGCTNLLFSGP